MRFVSLATTLVCIQLLVGCTFSKKSPQEVKADAFDEVTQKMRESTLDTRNAALLATDFNVSFVPGVQPNDYTLVVKAARVVPGITLKLNNLPPFHAKQAQQISVKLATIFQASDFYVTIRVKTNSSDNIPASDYDLGEYLIPRDYVFYDTLTLTDDLSVQYKDGRQFVKNYNRIIFEKGARIDLNGLNLKLHANELVFKGNNEINLHHKYRTRLPVEAEILDGADLTIKAKKSSGNLLIRMIGQEGNDGLSTTDLAFSTLKTDWGMPAENGRNGQNAKYHEQRVLVKRPDQPMETKISCASQPTDGEDGQDGAVFHGTNGTPGGDTGNLEIDIEDYSLSKFSIFFIPGKGGQGGAADFQGQKGGRGGIAGKSQEPCRQAKPGRDGRDSTQADSRPGEDGADGNIGRLIVPHVPQHFQVFTELTPNLNRIPMGYEQ